MSSPLIGSFRQSFIRFTPPVKILLLVFLVFIFLLASSILSVLLAVPLFHLSLNEVFQMIRNPEAGNIGVVKYFQVTESVFLFLVPSLIAAWLFSEGTLRYLKADTKPSGITIFLVLSSMIVAIPMMNALALFNSWMDLPAWMNTIEIRIRAMEESAGRLTELFLEGTNTHDLVVNLVMIAVLPALGEEFLFRGVLQRLFIEWTKNRHFGVWIASFIFSFIHFQFYGFIPRFLLGLYFGYLLVWSSSIWVPVVAHLINNGFAVIYYHFAGGKMGETALDKIGTKTDLSLFLSVILTIALLVIVFLHEKTRRVSPT